jgi:hypothetical protein
MSGSPSEHDSECKDSVQFIVDTGDLMFLVQILFATLKKDIKMKYVAKQTKVFE